LKLNKNNLDCAKVFEAFIAFSGDETRTAIACELEVEEVHALAIAENWASRLKNWNELANGDAKAVQIQINRAVSFIQGQRLRSVIDKLIQKLNELTPEELMVKLTAENGELRTRPIADLTKAAEAANLICSRALGDTPHERPEENGKRGSSMALSVLAALNAAERLDIDSVSLVKEQLAAPANDHKAVLPSPSS
jgi:hypothetical protein